MDDHILQQIKARAHEELAQESFRAAVDAEKTRLRAVRNRSLWQRLIDKLPFTITRKNT